MKVLLINGSPNEKGCTWRALKEVADTHWKKKAWSLRSFILERSPSADVLAAADVPRTTDAAYLTTIRSMMLDKMETADGLIVGSPVYFASPNGALILSWTESLWQAAISASNPQPVLLLQEEEERQQREVMNKYFLMSEMPIVLLTIATWNLRP